MRGKFAASRPRGMWMGGKVPLGYDMRDRKLVVNEAEAARVCRVFELFAETGITGIRAEPPNALWPRRSPGREPGCTSTCPPTESAGWEQAAGAG